MSSPLVTIAIPCYKVAFLDKAIASALGQTWKSLEVIVVDDGSPDDILSIVNRFSDDRLRYVRNDKNIGGLNPALNWNRCLELAQGEFFCLLCDDDLYEPEFVETLLTLAEKYPKTNVFRTRANFINREGREVNRFASAPEWESCDDYLWHVCNNYRSQTISEWVFRSNVLKEQGGYAMLPLAWYADYLTIFRVAQVGGIASTSMILTHFRLSGENISSKDDCNTEEKICAAKIYRIEIEKLLENNPNRVELLKSLDSLLKAHIKYNLRYASRKVIWQLFLKRRQYNLHTGWLWKAFWHTIFSKK